MTTKSVHIVPVTGVSIPPEHFTPPLRHVEQDVTNAQWEHIKAFRPPAFRRVATKEHTTKPSTPVVPQED
jgi:hypothetical protein